MSNTDEFAAAWSDGGHLKNPSDTDSLEMYAIGKIAKGEKAKDPGRGWIKGKEQYKYEAYVKKVDSGLTQDEAKTQYVELVKKLREKYGLMPDYTPQLK